MPISVPGTTILIIDETGGLATEATFGGGTPPTTANVFAVGCKLTDRQSGETYKNTGTSAEPVWDSEDEITTAEIADEAVTPAKTIAQETITESGALSVHGATTLDSSGGAIAGTLAAGTVVGELKVIVMQEASNSSTVSIANHVTSDPEVATFDAVDETLVLMWTGTEWATIYATATFV